MSTKSLVMSFRHLVVFLERLQSYGPLPQSHIELLGNIYHLSSTSNAEIRLRFYQEALLDPVSAVAKEFAPQVINWVVGNDGSGIVKGRMKFCRPMFRATNKVDHDLTVKTFLAHKTSFHPIAQKLSEKASFLLCSHRAKPLTNRKQDLGLA